MIGMGRVVRGLVCAVATIAFVAAVAGLASPSSPVVSAAVTDLPLDLSFNPAGVHPGVSYSGSDWPFASRLASLGDGSVVLVATHSVSKLTSSGVPDRTYGDHGIVAVPVSTITAHAAGQDGTFYVGNGFEIWRISPQGVLSAGPIYRAESSADLFEAIWPIGTDEQGRLLVQGTIGLNHGSPRALARLSPDGALDTTFAPGSAIPGVGPVPWSYAYLRPDRSFLLVATSPGVDGIYHAFADGRMDPTWNNGLGVTYLQGTLGGLEPDGIGFDSNNQTYLTGTVVPPQPCTGCHAWAGRLSADGVVDTAFFTAGTAAMTRFPSANSPIVTPDGHVLILTQETSATSGIMVLDNTGAADPAYGWPGGDRGYHRLASSMSSSPANMTRDFAERLLVTTVAGGVARVLAPTVPKAAIDAAANISNLRPAVRLP